MLPLPRRLRGKKSAGRWCERSRRPPENYPKAMKAIYCIPMVTAAFFGLTSCSELSSVNSISASSMGTAAQVINGTVVSSRVVDVEASSTDKSLGTGIGAALGAGSGALLGRGKGQIVSSVGFGVAGALLGRGVGAAAGKTKGQELVIKADGGAQQYSVIQPIYSQIGAIPVGTHGTLHLGVGGTSKFLPDGF